MSPLLRVLALAAPLLLAHGCATEPQPGPMQVMQIQPQAAANRQAQTRQFRDVGEAELLAAGVGVLQDLGFRIMASDAQLGVVTGFKQRPLDKVLLDIFPLVGRAELTFLTFGLYAPDPDLNLGPHQGFRVVLAMRPVGGQPEAHDVRVTFYRMWPTPYSPSPERLLAATAITSPALYQQFFALLSAALARSRAGN